MAKEGEAAGALLHCSSLCFSAPVRLCIMDLEVARKVARRAKTNAEAPRSRGAEKLKGTKAIVFFAPSPLGHFAFAF